jgi:S1-C subfamily serine protease
VLLLAAIAVCSLPPAASAESNIADLEAIENAFVALAEKVSPSVVAISTKNAPRSRMRRSPMVGSGVIIGSEGLILSNDHVVSSADRIYVTLQSGRRYKADIVSRDEHSDLAVIKIEADNLIPAEYGNLSNVKVGQFALAMGNPFGTAKDGDMSLSYGIVSALGKSLQELEEHGNKYYGNLIQTTADINPGNSGGPLFNIRGQIIGINTAIETRSGVSEGLGYAIPINSRTLRIIDTLAQGNEVKYGFLGVNIESDRSARRQVSAANRWGVVVTRVFPKTAADEAGLREDDLILKYDTQPVRSQNHLIRMVGATPVGETVPLTVYRGRSEMVIMATIGERNAVLASGEE